MSVPEEIEALPPEGIQLPAFPLAFVARQAIYDGSSNVIAYELLYRHAEDALSALIVDDVQATLHVIVNAALEIGLERLCKDVPVHINYPAELLEAVTPPPFHAARVVIEVIESVRGTPQVLEGLAAFRAGGYRIALDDFCPQLSDPALLDSADVVKLDIAHFSHEELASLVRSLENRPIQLIAERVETAEDFERCRALGFDAYQGYFLQHPQMFSTHPVASNRLAALGLIASLQNERSSINEVARQISQDVALSYQVLRCINSSYYGFGRTVASIRQAVAMLGFEKLHQLCALVALRQIEKRPQSIFVDAMMRARMCETIGNIRGTADSPALFITGLFSLLDVLTGLPMGEVLEQLPLSPTIAQALITQKGPFGTILCEVMAYERGAWQPAECGGLTPAQMQYAYIDAIDWAQAVLTMTSPQSA